MPGTIARGRVADGVLRIELDSADKMNILSVETRRGIMDAMKAHESDDRICCVVISSLGKVFSAGADLRQLVRLDRKGARTYSKFVLAFLDYVENYPRPTIGVVDGVAVGGGLELLMTLDMVIATPRSSFGQTELNVGLIPGGGGSQRLPRIVGIRKAKELIYTGNLLSAEEALRSGLLTKVVDPDDLQDELSKIFERLKSKNQSNLRLVKKLINEGFGGGLHSGLEKESGAYSKVLGSRLTKADINRFLERRNRS